MLGRKQDVFKLLIGKSAVRSRRGLF